jgi:hypothetical protein
MDPNLNKLSHDTLNKKMGMAPLRPYFEVWHLKLNDPTTQRSLWLRFTLLCSANGFRRIAETWAVFFQKTSARDVKKVAIKQSHDLSAFRPLGESQFQLGDCNFSLDNTKGSIQSKGNSIQWDLSLTLGRNSSFNFIPEILSKTKLSRHTAHTLCEDILVTGSTTVNGETIHWKNALGMHSHLQGPNSGHAWVWGHCNSFNNEQGKLTPFIFEGLTVRAQVGPFVGPKLSSFFFHYKDEDYYFNTLRDAIYIKSKNSLNLWEFQADRNEISFRGYAQAEHKDFAGLTYEDTNGSLLYCSHSELAEMKILVYRRGKLEATLHSQNSAGFEVVSREKNPYVPLLL